MKTSSVRFLLPALAMSPAVLIGAAAMHLHGEPAVLYMQNLLCLAVLLAASFFLTRAKLRLRPGHALPALAACAAVLACTFLHPGADGVHRWISLGPVSLHAASIALPAALLALSSLVRHGRAALAAACAVAFCLLLALQPDASMTTAYALASLLLLWREVNAPARWLLAALLGGLSLLTWIFLDDLAPVAYAEGIFALVCDLGAAWSVLGAASLLALLLPFFAFPPKNARPLALCFGVYFAVLVASGFSGHFPMPLMGYGFSPIIGYFIAILWATRAHEQAK